MKWFHTSIALSHIVEPSADTSITTTVYRNDFSRVWRKVNRFRGADIFAVLKDPTAPRNAVYTSILRGESDSAGSSEAIMIGPNQRDFVSQGIETRVRTNLDDRPESRIAWSMARASTRTAPNGATARTPFS